MVSISSGDGGYAEPAARTPARVALDESGNVDEAETRRLRAGAEVQDAAE